MSGMSIGQIMSKIDSHSAIGQGLLLAGSVAAYKGVQAAGGAAIRATDPDGLSSAERAQYSQDVNRWQTQNGISNPNGTMSAEQMQPYAATAAPDADDYRKSAPPTQTRRFGP
jgi:hypothetical protein